MPRKPPPVNSHSQWGYRVGDSFEPPPVVTADLPAIEPEPWPQPMGQEAFQGLPGRLIRLIEPASESDPAGLITQFLTAIGNAMGRGSNFIVEADIHYTNEYIAHVGDTSKGRKGTGWSHIKRVMRMVDPDWTDNCIKSGIVSGEGIIQTVISNSEKFNDKRVLFFEPEFGRLLRVSERSGSTVSAQLRDAWDSPQRMETLAKNNPILVEDALVSLIAHVTAEELRHLLTTIDQANGFGNRILWIAVRRSKLLPLGSALDNSALEECVWDIKDALEFARRQGSIPFDDEARDLWCRRTYKELATARPGLVGALTARAEAHVRRLATLYALLGKSPCCRTEHLLAAKAVWDYSERSVAWIFGQSTGDRTADTIYAALKARQSTGMTRTEISALFNRNKSAAEIAQALGKLRAMKLADCTIEYIDGKAVERWYRIA